MFLENGFKGKNSFWLYMAMFIVFFVSQFIGSIPLIIVIAVYTIKSGNLTSQKNPMDFTTLGIDSNLGYFLTIFPFVVTLIALLFLIKRVHDKSVKDVITARSKIDWSRVMFGAFIWLLFMVIINGIHYYLDPQNMVLQFNMQNFVTLVIITIIFIPIQTSVEEIFVRGYLTQGAAVAFRYRWLALLVPTLIFGILHLLNPEIKAYGLIVTMSQYLAFGLLFGLVTIMDDGIECALGAHAINNMFLAIFLTNEFSALQTPALFKVQKVDPVIDLLELIGASIIFLVIAHKKYKWGSWCILFKKVEKPIEV